MNDNNYATVYNQSDSIRLKRRETLYMYSVGQKISLAFLYSRPWRWLSFVRSWRPCYSAELM